MAHAARIENGIVQEVIVVPDGLGGDENDAAIEQYVQSIGITGQWVRASYNAASNGFRKRYPSKGDLFDSDRNEFVSQHAGSE